MITLETILERSNLNRAMRQVVANKGSAGVDRMKVEELKPYLMEHHADLLESIKSGAYKPSAVRRVQIPKEEKGTFRPLLTASYSKR